MTTIDPMRMTSDSFMDNMTMFDNTTDALHGNNVSGSFVTKLFAMVETEPDSVVTWIREGTAFCIVQPKVLAETYLPKYFRHGRFSSLIRQLNFYSFYKVTEGSSIIYQHTHFRQGRPDLLCHIKRRGAGKAKDPWIDPLANKRFDGETTGYSTALNVNTMPTGMNGHGDLCSSPLSKPLSGLQNPSMLLNDNMSPALKPGTAPCVVPPMVDLSSKDMTKSMMKAMRPHHLALNHATSIYGRGLGFQDNTTNITLVPMRSSESMMMKPPLWKSASESGLYFSHMPFTTTTKTPTKEELDENDVIDNAILDDLTLGDIVKSEPNISIDPRSVVLARDCLKLHPEVSTDDSTNDTLLNDSNSPMMFGPDDDCWEVPLSPLNDPEDIPWLDLSF
ncbi:hypothetical protein THRCLA_21204 [Thraustotheca clavata]|uniref:HSF-type DNA-binding domain-containing protein n=1 Tax=Thraustotheca clavata TaxID=74557 RepID=A0A1V9ZYY5_9STRA|nr:hypothetical protein THRCLA_21204 [Thraustotheca clavata]